MKDLGLRVALLLAATAAAGCNDQESPTAIESQPAMASAAAALSFLQMSSALHACGITSDSRLYCWGQNDFGEVGDGTTLSRSRPVPVAPSLRFKLVSVGSSHTCAVTTDLRVLCWGYNGHGQLGDGTTTNRLTPHEVTGDRTYRQVDAGGEHNCAVAAADDRAYCWGANTSGQLGHGLDGDANPTPSAVSGGYRFHQVEAGGDHSCGVTMSNVAVCWGSNRFGEIGDSSTASVRSRPVRVAGSHVFVQIDAGGNFTCAVTSTSRAWCWGNGREGRMGDGKTNLRFWPRAVSGGLSFRRVSTGLTHVCGETRSSKVYCWGDNFSGQLGDGTTTDRSRPVAVLGGLSFSQVSAGVGGTCGRTPAGVGYCWGDNAFGQVGDGTHTNRHTPVEVLAPS